MSLRSGTRRLRLPALSELSLRPRPVREWTLLGIFGVVLVGVVLSFVGGLVGVGLTIAFVVSWVFAPAVYSFALGHVLALGTTARALTVVELLFVEIGLLAVLFGPLTRAEVRNRGPIARATLGFGFTLGSVVVVGLALQDRVWPVSVLLVLAGIALVYSLHRYELVTLGLVRDDEDTDATDAGRDADAPDEREDEDPSGPDEDGTVPEPETADDDGEIATDADGENGTEAEEDETGRGGVST
jgi:hypothetical protein